MRVMVMGPSRGRGQAGASRGSGTRLRRAPPRNSPAGTEHEGLSDLRGRGEVVGGNGVQPVGVALRASVQGVLEGLLHRAGDLPGAAVGDAVVVDLDDRRQL